MILNDLTTKRLAAAKRAFTAWLVPESDMAQLLCGNYMPETGDLVFATVQEIGKHRKIEKPNGWRALMMPGDEIIVCHGNRYAPDQFEALVPEDLSVCDLVVGGAKARRSSFGTRALCLPAGLGACQGERLALALAPRDSTRRWSLCCALALLNKRSGSVNARSHAT